MSRSHPSSWASILDRSLRLLAVAIIATLGDDSLIAQDATPRALAAGQDGIARAYPGDQKISEDKRVVFVESFDDSVSDVVSRWESIENASALSLTGDIPPGASAESSSLLVRHVGGKSNGAHLYRRLSPGYQRLHYRFYVKFAEDCGPIHHFFHVGGYHPSTSWPQGGAGSRPEGHERFTTGVEPFGHSWQWDYYSYWMRMRGSPPRGQCWGNSLIHDPATAVTKGKWQCLELMMQLNDVGQSNGEMALWIDGKLMSHIGQGFPLGKWTFDKFLPGQGGEGITWSDELGKATALSFPQKGSPFEGFEWRKDADLELNFLWLLCYITKSPNDHVSHIWFDNVVVATDYIGPMHPVNP